jgi:hypothetical protein
MLKNFLSLTIFKNNLKSRSTKNFNHKTEYSPLYIYRMKSQMFKNMFFKEKFLLHFFRATNA